MVARRVLRALKRLLGGHGWVMVPPSWPYDLGYVLPRSGWSVAGQRGCRAAEPLSPQEEEAFRRLTAELAE
jgi:hypothetical protein